MRRLILVLPAFAMLLTAAAQAEVPQLVLEAEQARIASIEKAVKTAVAVFANGGNGGGKGVQRFHCGFSG